MNARQLSLALPCALMPALLIAAGPARADALQNQVLAAARTMTTDGYAFRRTIVVEQSGQPRRTIVENHDPRRPAAQRWGLVSIDGRAPTPKERTDAGKAKRGPLPAYANLVRWFGAPATRSDGAPGYVTYRFASLPKDTLKIGSHDASPDTQAEAVVNVKGKVPFVERVRMTSSKGFRMMLIASVSSIVATASYVQLPDGHIVPGDSSSNLAGSMMGKSGEMRSSASYDDFKSVN